MLEFEMVTRLSRSCKGRASARSAIAAFAFIGSAFLAASVGASDLTALSDAERAALRKEVRDYLIEDPELILEILAELQRRNAESTTDDQLVESYSDEIFFDDHSWVGGNADGDIAFVEFIDYRCGYCRRAYDDVETLIESDGKIRYVVKEFPILGPDSERSAKLALAALQVGGSDAYKSAHDMLISYNGPVSNQLVRRFAKDEGLDPDALLEGMDSDSVANAISANYALADSLGINGTPAFVIEGSIVRGWIELSAMRQLVDEARSDASR